MVKNLPVIGITMGDPAGIGPEITARALADPSVYRICRPIVIGDAGVMERALSVSGTSLNINPVTEIEAGHFQAGLMDVFDLANVDLSRLEFGKVSAMAGNAAFQAVHKTIELALQKKLDATVTGPIQKEALNLAGHHFSGHTEIYAHFTRTTRYAMLLVHKNMRVIHVSTHVSLRKACELVKKERILEVIALLNDACIQFGISHPRMGVAGLNPHAGDNGLFGNEEQQEILPAILEARQAGYYVEGPVPADTLFTKTAGGFYDGCVAMYHDQGHIPFKLQGFTWDPQNKRMKSVEGVNITLGLPVIRTSVDHGTAFDIAGQGIASPAALLLAIDYAVKMASKSGRFIK
jgi:4-hydroxythreonine-4-phosphate dehydrogenase